MKTIEIVRSCFKPGGARTPTILKRGSVVNLEDDQADALLNSGKAVPFVKKEEKTEEPKVEAPAEGPKEETPAEKPKGKKHKAE